MTRRLVVGPIAEREVVAAARWYEVRELGLGSAFVNEVLRTLDAIEREPENVPFLRAPYRCKRLDRFPYAAAQRVYVRAVAHGKRRPAYWDK